MAKEKKQAQSEEQLSSGDSLKLDLYFWLQALVMALVALILIFTLVGASSVWTAPPWCLPSTTAIC